jgi:hypothetical protein
MEIESSYNFISQSQNTHCFPVALCNAGIYLGVELDYNFYVDYCNCHAGGAMKCDEAIKESKLPLTRGGYPEVMANGGIFTISHPLYNLHSVFCYPYSNGVCFVNSWMGPNVLLATKQTFVRFLPKHENNQNFYNIVL